VSLLPHKESALRLYNAFSIHRQVVLDKFWDESEFNRLDNEPTIETWSATTHILRRLSRHLPFGRTLSPAAYDALVADLGVLKEDA